MHGPAKIIGIDTNERKKKPKGTAFGMIDFINPKDNNKSISQLIKELTGDFITPPSHKNGSYLNSNLHVPLTHAKLNRRTKKPR